MTATETTRCRRELTHEASSPLYWIVVWIFARLIRLLCRCEPAGQENFPCTGPTIVVTNHLHLLDPLAVMPVLRRKMIGLVADKWRRNPLTGWLLRITGTISIRRGEVDRQALRRCLGVLAQGGVLGIAPEGTRSKTGGLQRGKPGVAYLAARTDATIVPIATWGLDQLGDWLHLKRPTCHVVVGRPFRLPEFSQRPSTEELQELTDRIMIQIGRLLPEGYRGVYAERIAAFEAGEGTELSG